MDLQTFLTNIALFLNNTIMPFIMALAGFVFIWNAARYFIIGGANPDDQEKARTLALWGILAFVFIVSLWGIVKLMVGGLNLGNTNQPVVPDYMASKGVSYPSQSQSGTSPTAADFGSEYGPGDTPGFTDDSAPGETAGSETGVLDALDAWIDEFLAGDTEEVGPAPDGEFGNSYGP